MNLIEGVQEYSVKIDEFQMNFQCEYNPVSEDVVLFIHGLACSMDSFRNVLDYDHFKNKSLLMLDLIGFGKSSKPEYFSYKMEDQAHLIEKLLSFLPQWNFHIVAHSMGGAIALFFSTKTMSRVKSFSNIEGNLVSEDCGILSRGIVSTSYDEYQNNIYKKHLLEFMNHPQLCFEESTALAVFKSAVSLVGWSDSGELLNRFKNLSCRKSYFYGEENKIMPVLQKLDFLPKYMIHNSGHGMMTENPTEFYSMLADFIDQE